MTDARGLKIKPGDRVIHVQIYYSKSGSLRFTNGTIEKIQNGTVYIKKPGFKRLSIVPPEKILKIGGDLWKST